MTLVIMYSEAAMYTLCTRPHKKLKLVCWQRLLHLQEHQLEKTDELLLKMDKLVSVVADGILREAILALKWPCTIPHMTRLQQPCALQVALNSSAAGQNKSAAYSKEQKVSIYSQTDGGKRRVNKHGAS